MLILKIVLKKVKNKKKSTTNQYRDDGRGGAPD
jgi:hypothetical protein